MPAEMQTLEGTQLGNYDVVRRIRLGGMGAVYEGRQRTAFGRQVAIKVILGDYANDREMRRRFAREARTVAKLHHPHILPLIEFGEQAGLLFLVMPFIEGGTLTSFLRRELPDLQDIATIFLQLLDAVEYSHEQGLIHRDIKSSNVLLDARRGGKPYIYLADFGLVRTQQTSHQLETEETGQPIPLDQVPGTPHYMAPEQTRGIVTRATDIYALGVLLFQMLTGELPYDDADDVEVVKLHLYAPIPSPCERDASIPVELGEVTRKAMAKRPEQRFTSIAQMRQAFLAAIEGPTVHTTEDDPEIDVMASPPLEPPQLQLPLQRQRPQAPLLPPRRTSRQTEQQPRRARTIRLPRNPSVPLSQVELSQETLARAPDRLAVRRRHIVPQAPARSTLGRPARRKRGRYMLAASVATLVPFVLIVLLALPHVFGVYLFPASVPLFGAPNATVSVTVKSQTIANRYLLMASPSITQPDITTRALPDRALSVAVNGSQQVHTTGTRTIAGAQASGTILFDNSSRQSFLESQGIQFTASNGVVVMLSQTVTIPPRHGGEDGTVTAPAVAAEAGMGGNIAADTLNTSCCNNLVIVSNPSPFSGGVDAHVVHIVAQADLGSAVTALTPALQQQAQQQLHGQLDAGEVEAASPSFTTLVASDKPVGAQTDVVNVQVRLAAAVTVYNAEAARQIAEELVIRQATQQLGNDYQLKNTLIVAAPVITSRGTNGVLFLSVSAHGLWLYHFAQQQLDQWRQSIKGATLQLAQNYLKSQPGVASVHIQLPFGADRLPASLDQIAIVLVNM